MSEPTTEALPTSVAIPVNPLTDPCDAPTPNNSQYRSTGAFCFLRKGHVGKHQWTKPAVRPAKRKKFKAKRTPTKVYKTEITYRAPMAMAMAAEPKTGLIDPLDVLAEIRNAMKRLSVAQQKKMISILSSLFS